MSGPDPVPLSLSPRELCPNLTSAVVQVCVRDEDLVDLDLWSEPPPSCPVPPAVWGRILLQRLLREAPPASCRLADRLDLRHAGDVLAVRADSPDELQERADGVLARGAGEEVPGLLWAAATDPRTAIQRIASRFAFSSNLLACRTFVGAEGAAPHTDLS